MPTYPHAGYYQPEAFPNQRGKLTPGDQVGVFVDDNTATLATLYADRDRVTPAANPFTLDANGNSPGFYAEPAKYRARRFKNGMASGAVVMVEVEVDAEDAVLLPDTDLADIAFRYDQGMPAAVWDINHNLGFMPAGIFVQDSAGTQQDPAIEHIDNDTVHLIFLGATDGFALLS